MYINNKDMHNSYRDETKGKRSRKTKPRSQRKSLSIDDLINKKELKKKVEVRTMLLNKPMTYSEFKHTDESLQQAYLDDLHERYHVGTKEIAEMLGTSSKVLSGYCYNHDLNCYGVRGKHHLSKEDRQKWVAFMLQSEPIPEVKPDPTNICLPASELKANTINITKAENPVEIRFMNLVVDSTNVDYVFDIIKKMMVEGKNYNITFGEDISLEN